MPVTLVAGCFLQPPPDDPCREAREAQAEFLRTHGAEVIEWNPNGTVKTMKATGIFLPPGIENLKVDQSAPAILESIGPALLARGTEELRVRFISFDRRSGEIVIKLDEYMQGRWVAYGGVDLAVNQQTYQVTGVWAHFMPDRGLHHVPQLFADDAREAVRSIATKLAQRGVADAELTFADTPAELRYEFEQLGSEVGGGVNGGALVWVLGADTKAHGWCQVMVDASTGKVVRVYCRPPHDP